MENAATHRRPTFLGQPRGLVILFLTEMWERFSYYGMRGLLVLYLTQHFLFSDARSSLLYGAYVSLVYVMSVVGGVLADRYLGTRKAVIFGGILLCLGHLGMAFEGAGSSQTLTYAGQDYTVSFEGRGENAIRVLSNAQGQSAYSLNAEAGLLALTDGPAIGLPDTIDVDAIAITTNFQGIYVAILYLSLALIIAGVGFLKPNISSIVGQLYDLGDTRRDPGFTLFYMGINLGSLLSAVTVGWIGISWGWSYGFGLAGIGMVAGLITFWVFQDWLEGRADPPNMEKLKEKIFGPLNVEWACYASALGIILTSVSLIHYAELSERILPAAGIILFVYILYWAFANLRGKERNRLLAAVYFSLAQIPFWSLFEQAGTSLTLLTDRFVDREFMGVAFTTPMFQGLNPFFIIIFAPLMAWLWMGLAKMRLEPSTPLKFAFGVFLVAIGYLVLVAGLKATPQDMLMPVIFIVAIYAIHTLGELMLSPVGLSAMTKLAPASAISFVMSIWFVYTGLSNLLSASIAKQTGGDTLAGELIDAVAAKASYIEVYSNVAYLTIGVAILMVLVSPVISYLMKQDDAG